MSELLGIEDEPSYHEDDKPELSPEMQAFVDALRVLRSWHLRNTGNGTNKYSQGITNGLLDAIVMADMDAENRAKFIADSLEADGFEDMDPERAMAGCRKDIRPEV